MTSREPGAGSEDARGGEAPYSRDFLANLRHELRTPMNHIIGYSELLQEQADEDGLPLLIPDLKKVWNAGKDLLDLVNSRLDPTRGQVTRADLDWLRQELPSALLRVTELTEAMHRQAVRAGRQDVAGDLRYISAASARLLEVIWEDDLLAGVCSSGSAPTSAHPAPVSALPAQGDNARADDSGLGRILVVEDNQVSREMLARRLVREGHGVDVAEDGRQALELIARHGFDLVLLDLMMPEIDGFQVLERLKADPSLRDIPVVMLSALDEVESAVRCIEMGAEDYLSKPFNPVLLRARINACLEKKRLRDQEVQHVKEIQEERSRSNELLNVILPLGLALSAETEFERLAERILEGAKFVCNAAAGSLYLLEGKDSLRTVIMYNGPEEGVVRGNTRNTVPLAPVSSFLPQSGGPDPTETAALAALEGRTVNIGAPEGEDLGATAATRESSLTNGGVQSLLCVPLKNHVGEVIGVVQLVNARDRQSGRAVAFTPYLQQVVESLASQVAVVLNNQLLRQRETALAKFERDVHIGRQIQQDFLPETLVQPAGWEVAAYFSPAREVSGDFYDVFLLPGGHMGLVLADVCDKGVAAALFMALIRSLMRAFSEHAQAAGLPILSTDPPASKGYSIRRRLMALMADLNALNTVVLTNNYLAHNHWRTNMFATMFFGVVDPETGVLTYVNGGHEAPVLLGPAGIKARLSPTGPAVGMMPDMEFDIGQVQMEPGDVLLVYTDGVTDARNRDGLGFSEERLLALLKEPVESAEALMQQIVTHLRAHIGDTDQFDDITQLAVLRLPEA